MATSDTSVKFDVGFSNIVQLNEEDSASIRNSGLLADRIEAKEFDKYKYHVDVDGNSNAWEGLFVKLLSGGVVFKVLSAANCRQWYYDKLRPWYNFVPIKSDLSDAIDVIKYCIENDDLTRTIAARGQKLAFAMTYERELRDAARATIAFAEGGRSRGMLHNLRSRFASLGQKS